MENRCLAGGVALNCVANGKVRREGCFRNVWVQPAAGDAGGGLGAALAVHYIHEGQARVLPDSIDGMQGAYLGPEFDQSDIDKRLTTIGARFATIPSDMMLDSTAKGLADVHGRTARVAEDRAVAERAWPEFHPALEPANGLATMNLA
jgi:carbamoyltransferase